MKKYIFSLILILNMFNLFAYDKQAYKALLAGCKKFAEEKKGMGI